jgi:hypothetical protein
MSYISGTITEDSKIIVLDSNHNKITSKDFTPDSYTKLLLHFNESPLIDTTGKSLTLNGGVARSATQSKFGEYAGYFDGTDDYISIPDSNDWDFGSGNFTIDLWCKSAGATGFIVGQVPSNGNQNYYSFGLLSHTNGSARFIPDLISYPNHHELLSTNVINDDSWHHIAIVRNGAYIRMYIDGNESGTALNMGVGFTMINSAEDLKIGSMGAPENYERYTGYIDELRISKGIARWTSNFTPPAQAYKDPAPFVYNLNGSDKYAYTINNISTTSGTVIAVSNEGEIAGYHTMNFITSSEIDATGGMITTITNYRIHTFFNSGTLQVNTNDFNKLIDSLVIAGGGGGANTGAGGGAGGYVYTTGSTIGVGGYPVVVGTGGLGGVATAAPGAKGNNSTFNGITSEGGGGGWTHGSASAESGGCGAGGAIKTSGSSTPGGVGRQGYNGGAGYVNSGWSGGSGGGGGAGQAGEAGTFSGGKGGDGLSNSITGTPVTYAGGGGGGEVNGTADSAYGGAGGGGRANTNNVGTNGTNGLGGGGGGGSYNGTYFKGGNGGSGVVNIRYPWAGPELITSFPWTETFTGADNTLPSSTYWRYNSGDIKIYNNKLRITIYYVSNKALISTFSISGDFNIQVDLTMVTAPSTQNWASALYAVADNNNRFWGSKSYYNSTLYWSGESSIGGVALGDIAVNASYTGKIKLVRTGQNIYCYYHNGTSFVLIHSRSGFPLADIKIHLFSGTATNTFTTITDFDNFIINSASKVY